MKKSRSWRSTFVMAGVIAVAALIGTLFLIRSHAATVAIAVEAENGSLATATTINDATASGGKNVKFNAAATGGGSGFITRSGTKLMLNGAQYKFAGVNANAMVDPACRGENNFPTQAQLDQYFSQINPHSMTRIWYLNDGGNFTASLDRAVATATKYHQYLAVTLTDSLSQCDDPIAKNGSFWTSGYKGAYFTHIRNTVPRYKDSPAIGMWEIANEGNGGGNLSFYADTAALIKSLDPNHLVGTGSMPAYAFSSQKAYQDSQGANIDFVSVHEYDAETGESSWASGAGVQAAKALNKPVYVGEDGFCCNGGDAGSDSANASKLDAEYKAYLNDPYVAGMMYWQFDFGGTKGDRTAMGFGSALWAEAGKIANPYPGGN